MGVGVFADAQGVSGIGHYLVSDIGFEYQHLPGIPASAVEIDSDEGCIFDFDAQFLDRCYQVVFAIGIAAQNRGEEIHHALTAYRGTFMIPTAIAGNANVDIPAQGGIPLMYRRQIPLFDLSEQRLWIHVSVPDRLSEQLFEPLDLGVRP